MHRFQRWEPVIEMAGDRARVATIVRDYVNSIMPSDLSRMPESCRSLLARHVDDIPGAAMTLARADHLFTGDADTAMVLHEIAHTFVAASERIAQIEQRQQAA